MRFLVLDLETMPDEMTAHELLAVEAAQDYDACKKIGKRLGIKLGNTKAVDKLKPLLNLDKSGLNTNRLVIACIGFKYFDSGRLKQAENNTFGEDMPESCEGVLWNPHYTQGGMSAREGEAAVMKELVNSVLIGFTERWIGHGAKHFDLPALWKRAVKYGLIDLMNAIPHDKWGNNCEDTMQLWGGTDYQDKTSLETIAGFLDIPFNDEMDGSQVQTEIEAGNFVKVGLYCKQDVDLTWAIYQKLVPVPVP